MQYLRGFFPLLNQYNGFIFDLWGVLIDESHAFPEAVKVLATIQMFRKKTVFLSNAPRRVETMKKRLTNFNVPSSLYQGIITSGEETFQALKAQTEKPETSLKNFYLLCSMGDPDKDLIRGLTVRQTKIVEEAEFILNLGPLGSDAKRSLADFIPELERLAQVGAVMICPNPDLFVIRHGVRELCAGSLAKVYEALGGEVKYFGKPDPVIFKTALSLLGTKREETLMIGDALATDIKGATAVGLSSCWILDGIHGFFGQEELAKQEAAKRNIFPDYMLNRLAL